jgi:hypothetical protein
MRTILNRYFPFVVLLACFSAVQWNAVVHAGDVGVGRRAGGIAEIDPLSAVAGSTEVRSMSTLEGSPGVMQIRALPNGAVLGNGVANAEGQYAISLAAPLVVGQGIQAVNTTKQFFSSGIIVKASALPIIDEPVASGAVLIRGWGTPGHHIRIKDAVTNATLGPSSGPLPSDGHWTITLNSPLPLFHAIRAEDVELGQAGKAVSVLDLLTTASRLPASCPSVPGPSVVAGFTARTFRCGLPHPRGLAVRNTGEVFVVAGTAPIDPGFALLPAGVFKFSPPAALTGAGDIELFSPVNGTAVKIGPGGAFGNDLFVSRPRLFNVRGRALLGPDEGEIFRVNLASGNREATVFSRLLELAPTGMVFDPASNGLVMSSFIGSRISRITDGATPPTLLTDLSGVHGLACGPCPGGDCLYAAQPSSGKVFRGPAGGGSPTPFITGLGSPVDIALGPGGAFGSYVYVTDAGRGEVRRYNSANGTQVDAGAFVSGMQAPFGLDFHPNGSALFISDYKTGTIIRIAPNS